MPTFCRHNRLIQNCPICSREQQVELRPVLTSSAPRSTTPAEPRAGSGSASRAGTRSGGRSGARANAGSGAGVRVRRLVRGSDDGYRSPLVPGLKSSAEAERLAGELAFAATRVQVLATDPPGLYREAASAPVEEGAWLAFLIAYLGPLEGADPFASVRAARAPWSSGETPDLSDAEVGPRGAHTPARGARTLEAYRSWAARSGSQEAALTGEPSWTPERRFARAFERLALPGLTRDARFDFLVTLGALGRFELSPGTLALGGENRVTVGAKRALGIGDPLLLDRRARELAGACGVPLAALDLGLFNWDRGERSTGGLGEGAEPDPGLLGPARDALGL